MANKINQELILSSKKCYNISEKCCLTETTPPVYFVSDAKRIKQTTNNRRRRESYTLWRNLLNSTVLQKTANQETFAKENSISSAFRPLSSYRFNYSNYLCNNSWYKSLEQNKDAATKRCISKNSWNQKLSVCKQPAKISETLRSKDPGWHQQNSRPAAFEDVFSSAAPHKHSVRFRFNSSNNLRQTDRRSQSRLQSRQQGKTFLSPISMLRVLHQRLLARSLTVWGRIHCCRRSGIPERMYSKDSALYLPRQSTGGFGILRSQIHRTFRRKRHRLCASGKTDRRHKEKTFGLTLSPVQERLVSCRIPVYTNEMERTPSLCCDSQETSQQARGATNFVYNGKIFLSNIRYEHSFRGSQHLVFLQRPRLYRNSYQRTKTRFLFNKDTNEQLFGKSSLFFFASSGLQHNQLVQASLSAGTIEKCHTGYNPFGNFSVSGKIDKQASSKYSKASKGAISFKPVAKLYNSENRKAKDQLIFAGLLNLQNTVPSGHYINQAFSRFF